jgi:ankyrin repeat protein
MLKNIFIHIIIMCSVLSCGMPLVSMDPPPGKKARKPPAVNQDSVALFFKAAATGDITTINRLLAEGIPVDTHFGNCTALYIAAYHDHQNIVARLLQSEASINARNGCHNFTALHIAASIGHKALVRFLLKSGADKNAVTLNDETAESLARKMRHRDVANLLQENDSSPLLQTQGAPLLHNNLGSHVPFEEDSRTKSDDVSQNNGPQIPAAALRTVFLGTTSDEALLIAAQTGDAQGVLTVLEAEANLEAHDQEGMTALHYAAQHGRTNIVEILLALGVDVNMRDGRGLTPLHFATLNSHSEIIKILLTVGANPNAENEDGATPLHYAAIQASYTPETSEHIIELLLKNGAHLNAITSRHGTTPLHYAAALNRPHVVRALLQAGANTDARFLDGYTILHDAAFNGHLDVVACLLRAGANKHIIAKDGSTPLSLAQKRGHTAVALLLKLAGAKEVPAEIQDDVRTPAMPEIDRNLSLRITRDNRAQAQQANGPEQAQEIQQGRQVPQVPHVGCKRTFLGDGS